ncbi:MAG: hypothetical protein KC493_07910 [Bacteriovoracaceae bacterium]|nr:hypothetical protein [Bacteriovoracaceae bacterium]
MNRVFIFVVLTLVLSSCSSDSRKSEGFERRNLEEYFQSSGVIKYFLPDLPDWANSNSTGQCLRKTPVRYFNYKNLVESFALDYHQSVQFQYMYNIESQKLQSEVSVDYLPLKDEEKTFYLVSDKIQAGIYSFIIPKYKRIHLIWIDPALSSDRELASLKKLMRSKRMDLGHPVFVSLCLGTKEMSAFSLKHKFRDGIRFIPHTMFSPFNSKREISSKLYLNVSKLFKAKQKLYFYISKKLNKPSEVFGEFKVQKY